MDAPQDTAPMSTDVTDVQIEPEDLVESIMIFESPPTEVFARDFFPLDKINNPDFTRWVDDIIESENRPSSMLYFAITIHGIRRDKQSCWSWVLVHGDSPNGAEDESWTVDNVSASAFDMTSLYENGWAGFQAEYIKLFPCKEHNFIDDFTKGRLFQMAIGSGEEEKLRDLEGLVLDFIPAKVQAVVASIRWSS